MENSAKALLMAGGILVTMLIVVLLFYFKGKITEFYDNQKGINDIDSVAEFNKQFTNYERNNVHGYEIISLANMIEDYNTRHSGAVDAPNDEKYKPIELRVIFPSGNAVSEKIWYDSDGSHLFFDNSTLVQSTTVNMIVGTIINQATKIESLFGNAQIASKLAKSINSLIVNDDDSYEIQKIMRQDNKSEQEAIQILQTKSVGDYKAITKNYEDITYQQIENIILRGEQSMSIKSYYEYYQFKRAIFKCDQIKYDNDVGGTGRIIGMTFTFTGNIE